MKRWIFCCLSLLLVGTALAQTPADSVSRSEAIDSVVVTRRSAEAACGPYRKSQGIVSACPRDLRAKGAARVLRRV